MFVVIMITNPSFSGIYQEVGYEQTKRYFSIKFLWVACKPNITFTKKFKFDFNGFNL